MKKFSTENLANLAFVFAENMIERKKASLDAGTLSDDEKVKVEEEVAEFESLKEEFESKKFSSESTKPSANPDDTEVFAIIRKYVESVIDEDHEDQIPKVKEKLVEVSIDPLILDCVINHVAKIKGEDHDHDLENLYSEYDELVSSIPQLESDINSRLINQGNILEILQRSDDTIIKFAGGEGVKTLESGVKFLEEIVKKMRSAEEPKEEQIAEYDKAIGAIKSFIDSKKFTSEDITMDSEPDLEVHVDLDTEEVI